LAHSPAVIIYQVAPVWNAFKAFVDVPFIFCRGLQMPFPIWSLWYRIPLSFAGAEAAIRKMRTGELQSARFASVV
jgi:hypothetical protein